MMSELLDNFFKGTISDIDFLNLSRLSFGTDNWALIPSLAIYILPNTSIFDHIMNR